MQYEENNLLIQQTSGNSKPEDVSVGTSDLDFIPSSVIAGLPLPDSEPNAVGGTIELTETQKRAKAVSERREFLIESKPEKSVLVKEVKAILDAKLQEAANEMNLSAKRALKDPFTYTEAVKNYRLLYAEISSLEEISYETLKSRWLELVHGIK